MFLKNEVRKLVEDPDRSGLSKKNLYQDETWLTDPKLPAYGPPTSDTARYLQSWHSSRAPTLVSASRVTQNFVAPSYRGDQTQTLNYSSSVPVSGLWATSAPAYGPSALTYRVLPQANSTQAYAPAPAPTLVYPPQISNVAYSTSSRLEEIYDVKGNRYQWQNSENGNYNFFSDQRNAIYSAIHVNNIVGVSNVNDKTQIYVNFQGKNGESRPFKGLRLADFVYFNFTNEPVYVGGNAGGERFFLPGNNIYSIDRIPNQTTYSSQRIYTRNETDEEIRRSNIYKMETESNIQSTLLQDLKKIQDAGVVFQQNLSSWLADIQTRFSEPTQAQAPFIAEPSLRNVEASEGPSWLSGFHESASQFISSASQFISIFQPRPPENQPKNGEHMRSAERDRVARATEAEQQLKNTVKDKEETSVQLSLSEHRWQQWLESDIREQNQHAQVIPSERLETAEGRAAETETLRLQQERDAARADAAEAQARIDLLEKQLQEQTAPVLRVQSEVTELQIQFKKLEKSINPILQNTATPTTISFQELGYYYNYRLEWKIDNDLKNPPEQENYNINLKFKAFLNEENDNTKQQEALTQIALLKLKLINLGMSNLNSSFDVNKEKIKEMLQVAITKLGATDDLKIEDSGTLKFCQDFFLLGQQIAKVEQATDKVIIFERVTHEFGKDLITFSNKNVKDFRKFKEWDEFKKELTSLCDKESQKITRDEKDKIILLNRLLIPLREACIGYDKIEKIKNNDVQEFEITSDFAKVFVDLSREEVDNIFEKLQDDQKIKLRKLISSELLYLETEKANVNKYVSEEGIKGWVQSFYKDKSASKKELEGFFQKKIDSCTEIISKHNTEWGVASDDQALSNPIIEIKQSLELLGEKIQEVASLLLPVPLSLSPSPSVQEDPTVTTIRDINAAHAVVDSASPAAPAASPAASAAASASASAPAPARTPG